MKKEAFNDKALYKIFSSPGEDFFPENFNERIMQNIYQAQKKKERRNLLIVIFTSLLMLSLAFYTLVHYLNFNFLETFSSIFKPLPRIQFPVSGIYLAIGAIVLLLLWLDYRLRKYFRHSVEE